ncbi:MAG: branched-chain amino acid ABC transporter permease [Betaproteobacteria bacterium]
MSIDLIKNAIVLGSVYLLFATGFTLVFGSFKVMNLAHGAIMTLGAFVGIYADNVLGFPIGFTLVVAAIGAGAGNAFLDAVILRPIARQSASTHAGAEDLNPIVATLSFGTIVLGLLVQTVKAVDFTYKQTDALAKPFAFGGLTVSSLDLAIVVCAIVMTGLLSLIIAKTRAGMAVRAVAEDRAMASALGVRPNVVSAATFFVSGAMAGVCGVLVGILYSNVNVTIGDHLLLFGFVIVTVGGLGSLTGTAIAAYLVALVQTIANAYFQAAAVDLIVFGTLLLTLLIRPNGILGKNALSAGIARR